MVHIGFKMKDLEQQRILRKKNLVKLNNADINMLNEILIDFQYKEGLGIYWALATLYAKINQFKSIKEGMVEFDRIRMEERNLYFSEKEHDKVKPKVRKLVRDVLRYANE